MSFLSMSLIFFFIMDPIGNINSYMSMVEHITPRRRMWVVVREMLIALAAMMLFVLLGETIFTYLHLSEISLHLSAAIILFLVAIKILFLSPTSPRANLPKEEPFVIPLAIPLIAGPALLATIMLYALLPEIPNTTMTLAIFTAWLCSSIILLAAPKIKQVMGSNGLIACERLIGMLLIILAVQRFLIGIALFSKQYLGG